MRIVLLLASALALAGCGGGGHRRAATPETATTTAITTTTACPGAAKARRRAAHVPGDLKRLRAAARTGSHAATSRATDRFLLDIGYVPALRRNRLIDHAAAAVVGVCEDCFQALEAMRPIPALRQSKGPCT